MTKTSVVLHAIASFCVPTTQAVCHMSIDGTPLCVSVVCEFGERSPILLEVWRVSAVFCWEGVPEIRIRYARSALNKKRKQYDTSMVPEQFRAVRYTMDGR